MAEFCTKCAKELGFGVDINIKEEFDKLDIGEVISPFLCEGCGLYAIGKSPKGEFEIYYYEDIIRNKKNNLIEKLTPELYNSIDDWLKSKNRKSV